MEGRETELGLFIIKEIVSEEDNRVNLNQPVIRGKNLNSHAKSVSGGRF